MFRRYCIGRYCILLIIIFLLHTFCHPRKNMGTQRPNVSKYARSVSDGFPYALEACLVTLELPEKRFICSDVLGELWSSRKFQVAFSSHPKVLATLMGLVESLRT